MLNQITKPLWEALPENNRLERIWVLAKTDFLKRYYGSFLGVVWALINPLTQLLIYYFVFTIVFKSQLQNFVLFLFLGLVIYMFFAEASTQGLNLIRNKRYLLENIQLNWLDIYYASMVSSFFAFAFNFSAYLLVSLLFTVSISSYIAVFLVLILNLLFFTLAVQLILSVIEIFLKDIVHVWDLVKMALLWLSGVFYIIDPTATWKSAILAYITPLAGIISNARKLIIYGEDPDWWLFSYDIIYTVILYIIALLLFKRFSRKALEKI